MAARRFSFLSRFLFIVPAALAALAAFAVVTGQAQLRGEDEPEVPNAKYNFLGEITGSGVAIRSGPSENYYPTGKLDKGAQVKVVGIKFTWLKIEPPAGSFSYVGKAFVDRHGDGKVGKVNAVANVRAGSSMNPMKTTIQTKLQPGETVNILDEEDEYFRIEPPQGAYLYVSQQFVNPLGRADDRNQGIAAQPATGDTGAGGTATANAGNTTGNTAPAGAPAGATSGAGAVEQTTTAEHQANATPGDANDPSTTRRSTDEVATAPGAGSTTQPGGPATDAPPATAADARFEQLESEFAAATQQPVVDQPLADLLTRYKEMTQAEGLPESLKRIADARIAALTVRQDVREQLLATRKSREEMRQRNQSLEAERQELEERIKETQVEFYTAVGTLRPSSLQQGPRGTTLYRLTDPDTGRTLVYLRSADRAQIAPLLNQFVGVRGELRKDPLLRLNVIQPTEAEPIDQSRLGNGIAAAVMPPSLLPKTPTVSTEEQTAPAIEGQ